jgi:hypothetical protein
MTVEQQPEPEENDADSVGYHLGEIDRRYPWFSSCLLFGGFALLTAYPIAGYIILGGLAVRYVWKNNWWKE